VLAAVVIATEATIGTATELMHGDLVSCRGQPTPIGRERFYLWPRWGRSLAVSFARSQLPYLVWFSAQILRWLDLTGSPQNASSSDLEGMRTVSPREG